MRATRISLQAALFFLSLCIQAAPAEFDIAKIKKAKDKVTVEVLPERAAFSVMSSDGIGRFSATLKSGQWPRDVSIAVNRKTLEHFGLATDRICATGAVQSVTDCWCTFKFLNNKGESADGGEVAALRVRVEETKDGVEITFPSNLFVDTKQFSFDWIDAYRR